MIGWLQGTLIAREEDGVILNAGGVGYLVACSGATLARLPGETEAATLWVETIVREDAISLYGFASSSEQAWFRLLTTVQGIGARVALAILSGISEHELTQAIAAQNTGAFKKVTGVGPKLATRLVTELSGKPLPAASGLPGLTGSVVPLKGNMAAPSEVVSALMHLGYTKTEAQDAAARVAVSADKDASIELLITLALKELARL